MLYIHTNPKKNENWRIQLFYKGKYTFPGGWVGVHLDAERTPKVSAERDGAEREMWESAEVTPNFHPTGLIFNRERKVGWTNTHSLTGSARDASRERKVG